MIVTTLFRSLKIEYFQNFTKRKNANKITFCDPQTITKKQNELKEHLNNKRTKLDNQEDNPSEKLPNTDSNLMEMNTTVALTSNVVNTEINT